MALMLSDPKTPALPRGHVRGGKSSHKRPKRGSASSDNRRPGDHPRPGSESFVRDLLDEAEVDYEYEPTLFLLSLTGRGKKGFKPDFYLPGFGIYLEVTEGNDLNEAFKQTKIANVRRTQAVQVLLIGRFELNDLRENRVNILDLICSDDYRRDSLRDASIVA